MSKKLDLDSLHSLVAHAGVAIRVRQRLQPAGGAGDKVFPPTYVKERSAETKCHSKKKHIQKVGFDLFRSI